MSEAVQVPVSDFRANLSDYLEVVGRGGTVVVTSRGKPVARLVAPDPAPRRGGFPLGALAGRMKIPDDFDEWPEGFLDEMLNGKV